MFDKCPDCQNQDVGREWTCQDGTTFFRCGNCGHRWIADCNAAALAAALGVETKRKK